MTVLESPDKKETKEDSFRKEQLKLWAAILSVVITAIALTFILTQPAATPVSMTPLSGLIQLKSTAAKTISYEAAIANQKPTFIEFYADWCTTCQSMSATVEKLHQQYGQQVNFVMLNIDDPQCAAQVRQYKATGVPQFTLLDSAERSMDTWIGKVPALVFAKTIDAAIAQNA